MLLAINPNLTDTPDDHKRTHAGMAFFAGSGPPTSCSACQWWSDTRPGAEPKAGQKSAACIKYKQMMQGHSGPKVPASAYACKYFEERQKVPGT